MRSIEKRGHMAPFFSARLPAGWLRQWRTAGEDLRAKGMFALLSIFITGAVALFLVGLRDYFGK